jgi:hypothetical protein
MMKETLDLVATIEKHRPKPKLVECWLELNSCGGFEGYWISPPTEDVMARTRSKGHSIHHLREVTSAPEWERWETKGQIEIWQGETMICRFSSGGDAMKIVSLHNAEMKRVTGTEGK